LRRFGAGSIVVERASPVGNRVFKRVVKLPFIGRTRPVILVAFSFGLTGIRQAAPDEFIEIYSSTGGYAGQ